MNKKNIIIILFIFLMLSFACMDKTIIQNDTFYLIKLGDYISHNGIDLLDHYSWITQLSYTYPHWLHSILIYQLYNIFGFDGMYIFNLIAYMASAISIYYISLKMHQNKFVALFTSILSFPLLKVFINPRSQSISCILFLWEIYFITELIKTGRKKYIIYLMIDSLLIANIHGTVWMMFFILFLPFIANQIIYQIIKKRNLKNKLDYKIVVEKINNIKPLLIAFGLCFLMGLLTPSRICYTYYFKVMQSGENFISEHFPIMIIDDPIILISIFLLYFSKAKMKLYELFMIGGITIMALLSGRHLIFFHTIGLIYLSIQLVRNANLIKDKTFDILYNKIFQSKLYTSILLILFIIMGILGYYNNYQKEYVTKKDYPVDAVKYIKDNLDYQNIKIYNSYGDGSYLLFNDIKVFIDSRYDLYSIEFNKKIHLLNDYISIEDDFEYEELFEKYDIQYILIKNKYALCHILKNDEKYKTIHQDEYYTLFERMKEKSNEKQV